MTEALWISLGAAVAVIGRRARHWMARRRRVAALAASGPALDFVRLDRPVRKRPMAVRRGVR